MLLIKGELMLLINSPVIAKYVRTRLLCAPLLRSTPRILRSFSIDMCLWIQNEGRLAVQMLAVVCRHAIFTENRMNKMYSILDVLIVL